MEGSIPEVMYPTWGALTSFVGIFESRVETICFESPVKEWPLVAQMCWKSCLYGNLVRRLGSRENLQTAGCKRSGRQDLKAFHALPQSSSAGWILLTFF